MSVRIRRKGEYRFCTTGSGWAAKGWGEPVLQLERSSKIKTSDELPTAFALSANLDIPQIEVDQLARLSTEYAHSRDKRLRDTLILHHQRLVRSIATRFLGAGEALEDLIQVGNIGLINALERYNPGHGTRFSTYATPTILGEIKRHFRDRASSIKVPRWLHELNQAIRRASQSLSVELGRSPTIAELAARLEITEEEVLEALESGDTCNPLSLDTYFDGHGSLESVSMVDLIGGTDGALFDFENFSDLRRALEILDPREREVIELRFFDELSQAKIARKLNVSQMHVSRLQQRALHRLRDTLSEETRLTAKRRLAVREMVERKHR